MAVLRFRMAVIETSGLTKVYRTYRKESGLWGAVKGLVRRRHAPRTDQSRGRDRQRVGRWRSKRDSRSSDQRSRGADGSSLSLRGHRNLMTVLIRNGRIIDPANERDEVGDLFIVDGRIAKQTEVGNQQSPVEEIDATGLIVSPGLIDIHDGVHFTRRHG